MEEEHSNSWATTVLPERNGRMSKGRGRSEWIFPGEEWRDPIEPGGDRDVLGPESKGTHDAREH